MDKKYQVFISSTYTDMKAERQVAVEAILDAGHIPAGMELFAASDKKQIEVIKNWIDRSDIFMLVLGGRYGTIESNERKSYIQLEYEYALQTGKPYFALYLTDGFIDAKVKANGRTMTEQGDTKAYNEFRKLVKSKMCREINDLKDIHIEVPKAIRELSTDNKLEGWVRASSIPDISALVGQLAALRDENAALTLAAKTTKAELSLLSRFTGDFSESKLEEQFDLQFEYMGEDAYGDPNEVRGMWKVSYLSIFYLIATKLLEEPSDSAVRVYLDKVLREQLPAYRFLNVQEADFQSLKMKLAAIGVIDLKKTGKSLCWALTDSGKSLLMRYHAEA